jgi:poly [ADP-ribose] polymerase
MSMLTRATDTKADETQYLLSTPAPAAPAAAPTKANGSKKRAASPDASPAPTQDAKKPKIKENAKVGDGQNAKSTKIAISVDEYCPLASYQVFIDDDGTIFDASLNQTNAGANANKFYKVQVGFNTKSLHDRILTVLATPKRFRLRLQDLDALGSRW